jgi:hypothetical protein
MKIWYKYFICFPWMLASSYASIGQSMLAEAHEKFSGIKNLEIKGVFCDVEVIGGEGSMVTFDGKIKGNRFVEDFAIRHEKQGNRLTVWVDTPRISWGNVNGTLQFWVPKDCNLFVKNSSGNIKVANLQYGELVLENSSGNIRLTDILTNSRVRTASGSVHIENHKGNINASTSSGSQNMMNISGDITTKSSSGSVNIKDSGGNVEAEASSGSIRLTNVQGALNLRTTSGSIRGSGILLVDNSIFISSSGSITIDLQNDINDLGFDLTAGSGSIIVNGERSSKRYLTNSRGGLLINANSSSGSQTFTARRRSS